MLHMQSVRYFRFRFNFDNLVCFFKPAENCLTFFYYARIYLLPVLYLKCHYFLYEHVKSPYTLDGFSPYYSEGNDFTRHIALKDLYTVALISTIKY